ncbi:MAG: hypothetical protein HZB29_02160 [Nitrospinae bacterium]|nr:hypothetical protein [Nitrospinota bacterium]
MTLKEGVCNIIRGGGYNLLIGEENIFAAKEEAIRNIVKQLDPERCKVCEARVFLECKSQPGGPDYTGK